jgi:O-methyltransferase
VPEGPEDLAERYVSLLKEHLLRGSYRIPDPFSGSIKDRLYQPLQRALGAAGYALVRPVAPADRDEGLSYSSDADTMIGRRRLDNLQSCVSDVLRKNVPGDLLEAGVWRGGAAIFMRALLYAHGETGRVVWLADSFQGVPKPDPSRYPADRGDPCWRMGALAVDADTVRANFERYGLLDDQVRFLEGWFRDTLPEAPLERLALMRLDGDLYESTMDALLALYPKVSVGGYVIIDDYGNEVLGCRQAVDDFRRDHGVTAPIQRVDWTGVYWVRDA